MNIIITEDGSHTLYVPGMDEHYHSVHGALQESEYIFIKSGFNLCRADPVRIFEAGFGTGLNALLTAVESIQTNRKVFYASIEKYPLKKEIISSLNYPGLISKTGTDLFEKIHSCKWDTPVQVCDNFTLLKIHGDLISDNIDGVYDLIYFDAFGPDKQPGMWTEDIFRKISEITAEDGIFITYSAKGEVKRNLKKHGFAVTLLPGPPGKRHIISAIKEKK